MRTPLIIVTVLAVVLLYMLAFSTGNTSALAGYYWWVFALNGLIFLGLSAMVVVQLWRLRQRLKTRVFGAKLTQRLVLMFALMAVVPGVLVFTVSAQFLTRSIESWFNVSVENALDRGLDLGRNALGYVSSELARKSRVVSSDISDLSRAELPGRLERLRETLGLREIAVFSRSGELVGFAGPDNLSYLPVPPSLSTLSRLTPRQPVQSLEGEGDRITIQVLISFRSDIDQQPYVLRMIQAAPETIARDAELIDEARTQYQQLLLTRDNLRQLYMLTLVLVFALTLMAALAFALYLSERLSAPLSELAAGTRAVAQGDFSRRHPVFRRDELGMLTTLFNRMTQQLEEARQAADDSRSQVEAAKLYLESILVNLTAGVMAFSADGQLRAGNPSAARVLGVDFADVGHLPLAEWPQQVPALAELVAAVTEEFARQEGDWQSQIDYARSQGTRTLLVRGSRLPERSGSGFLIVFDDITELARAQRDAAWGEVAKRLAHEIRNPLTPIQLSAERLAMKLESKLEGPDADMLRRATDTIIKQVGALKSMVDAFRDYARAPRIKLARQDLNTVIREVLALYEGNPALRVELCTEALPIMADAALLRQVLHNLLQNALDAVLDVDIPIIQISSRPAGTGAVVSVSDNGAGFAPEILSRAFEPYVTSKSKGTGLGLAVVKKIVEEHHGQITLSNAEAGGALVSIALPLLELEA